MIIHDIIGEWQGYTIWNYPINATFSVDGTMTFLGDKGNWEIVDIPTPPYHQIRLEFPRQNKTTVKGGELTIFNRQMVIQSDRGPIKLRHYKDDSTESPIRKCASISDELIHTFLNAVQDRLKTNILSHPKDELTSKYNSLVGLSKEAIDVTKINSAQALAPPPLPYFPSHRHYTNNGWGFSHAIPPTWFYKNVDGFCTFGSCMDSGLIIVKFHRQVNEDVILRRYSSGFTDCTLVVHPIQKLHVIHELSTPDVRVLYDLCEIFDAKTNKKAPLCAQVILLFHGNDCLVLFGVCHESRNKLQTIAETLYEIAGSVNFMEPTTSRDIVGMLSGKYYKEKGEEVLELFRDMTFKWTTCESDEKEKKPAENEGPWIGEGTWNRFGNELEGELILEYKAGTKANTSESVRFMTIDKEMGFISMSDSLFHFVKSG
ncbi:hypothetical protein AKO1_007001 [Acrasis kona]|uniref:Uncharacterized protein n=1 Tax=Acrasis kona TaxID=1008807 RepID=A0AAW2YWN0_9EUKA